MVLDSILAQLGPRRRSKDTSAVSLAVLLLHSRRVSWTSGGTLMRRALLGIGAALFVLATAMQFTRPPAERQFEDLALLLIGALAVIYGLPALWRWGTASSEIPEGEIWRPGRGPTAKDTPKNQTDEKRKP